MRTLESHTKSARAPIGCVGLILGVISACSPGSVPEPAFGHSVAETCPARDSERYFFAPASITHESVVDNQLRADFAHLLSEIDGKPLWCGGQSMEAFRLVWFPVRVAPLVITATKVAQGWKLQSAEFSVTPLQTPDPRAVMRIRLSRKRESTVNEQAGMELTQALEKAKFWSAPRFEGGGEDGYAWTIEGRSDGRYRVVTRRNASDTAFEDAARVLVRLSGVPLPAEMRP